jgi:hypothetical protein
MRPASASCRIDRRSAPSKSQTNAVDVAAPSPVRIGACPLAADDPWHTPAMTRRMFLLVLLAIATAWLAYLTWPAKWRERAAERAAISRCKDIRKSDQLDLPAMRARLARCDAMEAAFRNKW